MLVGKRVPSCNKMTQIPNKKVFYARFVKQEGELEEEENPSSEVSVNNKGMLNSSVALYQ